MKTLQKFILVFALILFSGIMNLNAQTVYVTEKGKKYHAKNCDLVKSGKKGMELAAAKKAGFGPCGHCKVEATADKKEEAKKEKPAKTTGKKK
jgi:hypothetical protein